MHLLEECIQAEQVRSLFAFSDMKRHFFILLVFLLPLAIHCQSLPELNAERLQTNKRGMLALGTWATGNIAYSGARWFAAEGEARRFHQMNVWWNVVNLGIAGVGYLGSRKIPELDLEGSLRGQRQVEKAFLFNTGLDVGYMATGLWLQERGRSRSSLVEQQRLEGWGKSLIMQGAFLFGFDLVMYLIHRRHGNKGVMQYIKTL